MQNSTSKTWLKPGTRQCLLRRALIKSMGYTDAAQTPRLTASAS